MATPPDFTAGAVLTAAQMNAIGLWLVRSQTIGNGVNEILVDNVFTSDFDNYRIIFRSDSNSSSNENASFQLRTSAPATINTNYATQIVFANYGSGTVSGAGTPLGSASINFVGGSLGTNGMYGEFDLIAPNLPRRTVLFGPAVRGDILGTMGGYHNVATAYPGFRIFTSGTMTGGTLSVYGYNA
jgi:hypothetical protein